MKHILGALTISLVLSGSLQLATAESVIAPGPELEKLAGDFKFSEGPTCDRSGNVFFTDQPNDRILKWSVDDAKLSTYMQPSGRANGMYFDANGNLIACADETNALWSIAADGKISALLNTYKAALLNGPNDVWVAPNGGMYFTDPYYQRPWWEHKQKPQAQECVYYLAPDHKELTRVAEDFKRPNGIIGTPDGRQLYVADIDGKKTYRYDIQPNGSLTNKAQFCELGSDGMTLDTEGNLYLTGKGVIVFDKTGKEIERIEVPEGWTANVSFGGKDHDTLFITASKSLYSIRLRVKGADAAK